MSKKIFTLLKAVFLLGFLVLLAMIIYGVVARDISAEGNIMLDLYWGKFTFYDIYIAFIVFYLWVVFRENSILKSILWFFLIMLGGSMSICLYMFIALSKSDNDVSKLMMGERKNHG